MRFDKNNVLCPKYIDIYEFRGGGGGDVQIPTYIFCSLLKKTEKVHEHDIYSNTKIKFYIILI